MKRNIFIVLITFVFLFSSVAVTQAITVTASPNPATVGQNVMVTITASSFLSVPWCNVDVNFGDGSPWADAGICAAMSPASCTLITNHTYATTGIYAITARKNPACTGNGFVAPDPATTLITVACMPLTISTPSSLPSGTVAQAYSSQILTSGGQVPVTFSLASGSMPPGLNLGSSGLITGNPVSAGTYSFTVRATDSCVMAAAPAPQSVQRNFSITINAAPCPALSMVTTSPLVSGTVGQAYSSQILTSGGQVPVTFSLASGVLPPGLNIGSSGLITGTPTSAGTYSFTVEATDSCALAPQSVQGNFSITVNAAPCPALSIISPSTLTAGTVNQGYSYQMQTTGGQIPVRYRFASDFYPPGLSLSITGLISGIPTASGNYTFSIRATDSCSIGPQSIIGTFTIQVESLPGTLSVNAVPSSFSIPRGYSSSDNVLYQFTGPSSMNTTLNSSAGNFLVGSEVIGTNTIQLTAKLQNGNGRVSEVINIPVAVIERALKRGSNTFVYTRNFSDSSLNVTATVNFIITTEAGADFEIKRIDLYFENRRPEITVNRSFPKLRAFAYIRFVGSGFLQGYWEVDGRLLSHVDQHLTYGASVTFQTPDIPPLPTFDAGTHLVRFIITNPTTEIPLPSIVYFVTAAEGPGKSVNIKLLSPENDALLEYAPGRFEWENIEKTTVYLIQFYDKTDSPPVFSAYARTPYYSLPAIALKNIFSPGQRYFWKVSGFNSENNVIGESETRSFIFRPYDSYVKRQIITALYESEYSEQFLSEQENKYALKQVDAFTLKSLNLRVIVFETKQDDLAVIINELKKDSRVLIAQPNYILNTMSDPMRRMQYASDIMGAEKIHALYTGKGIRVAVIDTGVDAVHDDLKGRILTTENVIRGDKYMPEIHGTAVAGIIAAGSNGYGIEGVAPGADIIALRACRQISKDQPEGECYTDSLAKALDRAIDQKAHIVNMSFGNIHYDGLLAKLIDRGSELGILFIAPAGNFKNEMDLRFPASHHAVISVGGFDEKLNPYPNPFITKKTSVCAPAVNIITTVPDNKHNFMTGTSMSSAYITGILAIALEKDKSISKNTLPYYQGDICKWEEELLKIKICEK